MVVRLRGIMIQGTKGAGKTHEAVIPAIQIGLMFSPKGKSQIQVLACVPFVLGVDCKRVEAHSMRACRRKRLIQLSVIWVEICAGQKHRINTTLIKSIERLRQQRSYPIRVVL